MTKNILPGPIEAAEIEKYLPHRYPFLLIDRVLSMEVDPEKKLTGIKNVTKNEPFFEGHFPGNPVMPGVLIIEAKNESYGNFDPIEQFALAKRKPPGFVDAESGIPLAMPLAIVMMSGEMPAFS